MKRKLVSVVLSLLMLLLVPGCVPKQNSVKTETTTERTLKIATLRGPSAVSIIPMIDAKSSLNSRVKAEYLIYNSPDLLIPDLVKGQVDAALLPPNLAAKLYNKGVSYQLAATTCWGVMYIASNNRQLVSIKDLKGQKIFLTDKGATPDLVFHYLLSANGIKSDEVTLDYSLGQTELAQTMAAGRINTGLLVEPWISVVTSGNPKINTIIDMQKEWQSATNNQPLPQTCLIVKKSLATEDPTTVTALLAKVAKAINWVNSHPDEAGKLVEKNGVGTKASITAKAIPRLNLRFENAVTSKPALESFFKIINQSDPTSTGGKLPDDGFYYQK